MVPLLQGRARVKVYGKFDKLTNETIPWATPQNREAPGMHIVPRVGDIVAVRRIILWSTKYSS